MIHSSCESLGRRSVRIVGIATLRLATAMTTITRQTHMIASTW